MHRELADFLDYCRIEQRLAPVTSACDRDVGTASPSSNGRESSR